jgi:hypothetical protein
MKNKSTVSATDDKKIKTPHDNWESVMKMKPVVPKQICLCLQWILAFVMEFTLSAEKVSLLIPRLLPSSLTGDAYTLYEAGLRETSVYCMTSGLSDGLEHKILPPLFLNDFCELADHEDEEPAFKYLVAGFVTPVEDSHRDVVNKEFRLSNSFYNPSYSEIGHLRHVAGRIAQNHNMQFFYLNRLRDDFRLYKDSRYSLILK